TSYIRIRREYKEGFPSLVECPRRPATKNVETAVFISRGGEEASMDDKSDLLHMQMAHLPLRLWLRRCVSGESHENLTEGVNLKPVSFMSQLNYICGYSLSEMKFDGFTLAWRYNTATTFSSGCVTYGPHLLFSGSVDNSINSHIEMCRTLICCSICFQEQPASFRVCCDGSPSAANNVFTLIAVIIFYGFLITPYRRFITVKAIFINFTVRRLHQNGFKSAYQAMMKYNNVQLAEDHVAHRHARALERSQIFNQTTTELSIDEKDNIYDFEKTYENDGPFEALS
ncbi:hypothetical protein HID58_090078, partial [Brassica napus]